MTLPPGSAASNPRYRLDSRIATGGMGEVWRATDTVLGREVAVKVLKAEYADDPTFRSRFESEAKHAAALHHPNIASVFDFGELQPEDGSGVPRPYLVMELVPGKPLSALLRQDEPMPADTAAGLVAQATDGIAAAHAIGVVHRDVKPANLLVTPDGQVKITDFGIARAVDGATLTRTGQVLGTPAYFSPEQAEGRSATEASDIYSLGVVLYECLAGRRPFEGESPIGTALAHVRDQPPPLPDEVPDQLRRATMKALAKNPAARFGSVAELGAALRGAPVAAAPAAAGPVPPVAEGEDDEAGTRVMPSAPVQPSTEAAGPTGPADPGDRRRRGLPPWWPWVAAALGVLVVVVLLAWLGQGDPDGTATPTDGGTEPTRQSSPRDSAPAESPTVSESPSPTPEETPTEPTEEPSTVTVNPDDYIGRPAEDAAADLSSQGLEVDQKGRKNDGEGEPGTVADVSPSGELKQGQKVSLFVWDEPKDEPKPKPKDEPKNGPKSNEDEDGE